MRRDRLGGYVCPTPTRAVTILALVRSRSMNSRSTTTLAPLLAVVLAATVACAGSPTTRELTDAREILVAGLRSTAALSTAHVRAEVAERPAGDFIALDGASVEGDLAIAARELSVVAAAPNSGLDGLGIVVVAGMIYTRTSESAPWSVSGGGSGGGDPLAGLPTTAEVAESFERMIRDPGLSPRLEGIVDCGGGRCYEAIVEIPGSALDAAFADIVEPGPPPAQSPGSPSATGTPDVTVQAFVGRDDLRLHRATFAFSLDGRYYNVVVTISDHDAPLRISPPPIP